MVQRFAQRPWTPTQRRGHIAAELGTSPGPACVTLPSYIGCKVVTNSRVHRGPAYSLGARQQFKTLGCGPGPGTYNVQGLSNKGKDNQIAVSLSGRHKPATAKDIFPSPCQYDPAPAMSKLYASPKYTFGLKARQGRTWIGPAPNLYNIPSAIGGSKEAKCPAAPAYTIVGRHPPPKNKEAYPGPGAYDASDTCLQRRPAAYTIRARLPDPALKAKNPGPGAYYPEKVNMEGVPAHSFGIRHSPYRGHIRDADDI